MSSPSLMSLALVRCTDAARTACSALSSSATLCAGLYYTSSRAPLHRSARATFSSSSSSLSSSSSPPFPSVHDAAASSAAPGDAGGADAQRSASSRPVVSVRADRAPSSTCFPSSSSSSPPSSAPSPSAVAGGPRSRNRESVLRRVFSGKDVLTCMCMEHRLVDWLWERYRATDDADALQRIVQQLALLLTMHMACEESAVYPVIRREADNGPLLADSLLKEHFVLKGALYRLQDLLTVNDSGFGPYVAWTYEQSAAHARREEAEIVPWLRAHKNAEQLGELGALYNAARAVLPSRPPDELFSNRALSWVEERMDQPVGHWQDE